MMLGQGWRNQCPAAHTFISTSAFQLRLLDGVILRQLCLFIQWPLGSIASKFCHVKVCFYFICMSVISIPGEWKDGDRRILGTCWPAGLAKLASFPVQWDILVLTAPIKWGETRWLTLCVTPAPQHPAFSSGLCEHLHAYVHTYAWTQMQD